MVFSLQMAGASCALPFLRRAYPQPQDFRFIARRRALMLVVKIETMTSSVDIPKQAEVESAVRGWIDDCVWRREIKRAETGGLDFFENLEIEKMGCEEARELDGLCIEPFCAPGKSGAAI